MLLRSLRLCVRPDSFPTIPWRYAAPAIIQFAAFSCASFDLAEQTYRPTGDVTDDSSIPCRFLRAIATRQPALRSLASVNRCQTRPSNIDICNRETAHEATVQSHRELRTHA